eukprot:7385039-Prymnesium_polylepis.2
MRAAAVRSESCAHARGCGLTPKAVGLERVEETQPVVVMNAHVLVRVVGLLLLLRLAAATLALLLALAFAILSAALAAFLSVAAAALLSVAAALAAPIARA